MTCEVAVDQDLWQTPISVGAGGAGLGFDLHPDLAALSLCDPRQVNFPSALNFLICIKYQDSAGLPGRPESRTRTLAWRLAATQEISAVTRWGSLPKSQGRCPTLTFP